MGWEQRINAYINKKNASPDSSIRKKTEFRNKTACNEGSINGMILKDIYKGAVT